MLVETLAVWTVVALIVLYILDNKFHWNIFG